MLIQKNFYIILAIFILSAGLIFSNGCDNTMKGKYHDDSNDDGDDGNNPAHTIWYATNGPYGGRVNAFFPDNQQRAAKDEIYAIGSGGIYYTADAGVSWVTKNNGILPKGEIQGIDGLELSNILFVGIKNKGIYYTTDGGTTWKIVTNIPLDVNNKSFFAISAVNPTNIYVGVTDATLATTAKFYICADNGDNNWTWTERSIPAQRYDDGRVKPMPRVIYTIVRNPTDYQYLYVGTEVDVYHTTNAGINWKLTSEWLPYNGKGLFDELGTYAYVTSLALLYTGVGGADILYAGLRNTSTTDTKKILWRFNGQKWEAVYTLAENTLGDQVTSLKGLYKNNQHRLYMAFANRGIFYSSDASASIDRAVWVEKNKKDATNDLTSKVAFSMFVFFEQGLNNNDLIYRNSFIYGMMMQNNDDFFQIRNNKLLQTQTNALAISNADSNYVVSATLSGIFIKNANDNWVLQENSVKNNYAQFYSLVASQNLDIIYAGAGDGAYLSLDKGINWTKDLQDTVVPDLNYSVLLASNVACDKVWMANKDDVYYRTGASAWDKIQSTANDIQGIVYASGQGTNGYLYAATTKGLQYNDNAMDILTLWNNGLNTGLIQDKAIQAVAANATGTVLAVGVLGQGVYFYNPNKAAWETRKTGLAGDALNVYSIFLNEKQAYICTDDGIWYISDITDNTQTWKDRGSGLNDPRTRCIVVDPNDANLWYIGTEGYGVWKTKTAGQ